jgi:hypothetical protein
MPDMNTILEGILLILGFFVVSMLFGRIGTLVYVLCLLIYLRATRHRRRF